MKIILILVFYTILYNTPLLSMDKKKQITYASFQKKKYPNKRTIIKRKKIIPPYARTIKERLLAHCMKHSEIYLSTLSTKNDYNLYEIKKWLISISLVNKHLYETAQKPFFIKRLIRSIADKNDLYTEEEIASTLNTPGTRKYIHLNNQLFNINFRNPQKLNELIKTTADQDYRRRDNGLTPLMYYIYQESLPMVQLFLESSSNMAHYHTIDPISASITILNVPIFNILMKHKPNNFDLYFPLRYAIERYSQETKNRSLRNQERIDKCKNIIVTLLRAGADATEGFIYAIEHEYFQFFFVKTFMQYNANPNEVFTKIIEYILTTTIINEDAYKVMGQVSKSPLFTKNIHLKTLETYQKRINIIKTIIN